MTSGTDTLCMWRWRAQIHIYVFGKGVRELSTEHLSWPNQCPLVLGKSSSVKWLSTHFVQSTLLNAIGKILGNNTLVLCCHLIP